MLGTMSGAPAVPLTESFGDTGAPFDFDGSRVAYRFYRCIGTKAFAVDEVKTAVARGPIHLGACRAEMHPPSEPVRLRRGFDLRLNCPRGCAGAFHVTAGRRKWKLRAQGVLPLRAGKHTIQLRASSAKPATDLTEDAVLDFVVRQPDGQSTTYTAPIKIRRPG